jgi:hypothetical protein
MDFLHFRPMVSFSVYLKSLTEEKSNCFSIPCHLSRIIGNWINSCINVQHWQFPWESADWIIEKCSQLFCPLWPTGSAKPNPFRSHSHSALVDYLIEWLRKVIFAMSKLSYVVHRGTIVVTLRTSLGLQLSRANQSKIAINMIPLYMIKYILHCPH